MFLFTFDEPETDARAAAEQYGGQGHEISFLPLAPWIVSWLGTIGPKCRRLFNDKLLALLDQPSVPARVKIAWNEKVTSLLA